MREPSASETTSSEPAKLDFAMDYEVEYYAKEFMHQCYCGEIGFRHRIALARPKSFTLFYSMSTTPKMSKFHSNNVRHISARLMVKNAFLTLNFFASHASSSGFLRLKYSIHNIF